MLSKSEIFIIVTVIGNAVSPQVKSREVQQASGSETWLTACQHGEASGVTLNLTGMRKEIIISEPDVEFNETAEQGLTMCVLNQRTGRLIFYREFPFYKLYAVWQDLQRYLMNLSPERIVILHIEGYSINGLRNATNYIANLGSLMIGYIGPTSVWTWIFVSGGRTMFEKVVDGPRTGQRRITLSQVIVSLSDISPIESKENLEKMRWEFCAEYGVMGDLCDERKPANLNFDHLKSLENPVLKSIPVIITAGNRTSYLYQSLKSFFKASGVVKDNFHVVFGTLSVPGVFLLKLLNITYTSIPPSAYGRNEFASFHFYRNVYQYVLTKYHASDYVIFLEEDVEISPDFFSYISQTVHFLWRDPTLYCITGYSTTGLKRVAHDETALRRANVQVGWGYAVTLSLIKQALFSWPDSTEYDDDLFDNYIYLAVKGNRECIMPEVSRSFHFGIGINTLFDVQEIKNSAPLASSYDVKFKNIDRLELSVWSKDLYKSISEATPTRACPCRENYLKNLPSGSYVMYYNFTISDKTTYFNNILIGNCFRAWTFSEQGQHDSVAIINVTPNITYYLVAVPDSSFARLRPKDYLVYDIRNEAVEDFNCYVDTQNYLEWRIYNNFKNFSLSVLLTTEYASADLLIILQTNEIGLRNFYKNLTIAFFQSYKLNYSSLDVNTKFFGLRHLVLMGGEWKDDFCQHGKPIGKVSAGRVELLFRDFLASRHESWNETGLLMCVVNQRSGDAIFRHVFPFYELFAVWIDLTRHLNNLASERIVILHIKGHQSIYGLRNATKLLSSLGSHMVENLTLSSIWTWVFTTGGKTVFENVVEASYKAAKLKTSSYLTIPLSNIRPILPKNHLEKKRWEFCAKYGLMGDLCDENEPANLNYSHLKEFEDTFLKNIPVIVTAGKRTSYLYQSLKSYLKAFGVVKDNIHVLSGAYSPSTIALLALLNIKFTYIPPSLYQKDHFAPFLYYREIYQYVFDHHNGSEYVIILEEDVEVSRDFFSYISQAVHLLRKDPTLYCITGHSSVGLKNLAHDESVLLRGEVQVGWGYALALRYVEEALREWPKTENTKENRVYDGWMFYNIRRNRECVFPEVSRSLHFGIGLNTNFWLAERTFLSNPLAKSVSGVKFKNIDQLELSMWKRDLRNKIAKAIPTRLNPCREDYLKNIQPGAYAMFYIHNFEMIGACFGTWIYSMQGQHDSVAIIKLSRHTTFYLVGCPQSSFSDLRPRNYSLIDVMEEPSEEIDLYIKRFISERNRLDFKFRDFSKSNMFSLFS